MKKLLIFLFWLPTTFATLLLSLGIYSSQQEQTTIQAKVPILASQNDQNPYQLYFSVPKVLGTQSTDAFYVQSQDILPKLVELYLKKYNSPMADSSQDLISAAQKHGIDPIFMVAIAQCESNLGRKMPHSDSEDPYSCHNPFGWGIHSQGTLCFDTWQAGYEAVAAGLRSKYYNKGYENTEEIMEKYTPPALEKEGSWAKCVNHFMDDLNEIKGQM